MELRRAILLFAIILGLAAIATSVQRPDSERQSPDREAQAPRANGEPTPPSIPSASARTGSPISSPPEVTFPADLQPETESLKLDRATTVIVTAEDPGEVEIPRLGLSGYAQRLAPARFELLPTSVGGYDVFFSPTDEGPRRKIGVLDVAP